MVSKLLIELGRLALLGGAALFLTNATGWLRAWKKSIILILMYLLQTQTSITVAQGWAITFLSGAVTDDELVVTGPEAQLNIRT